MTKKNKDDILGLKKATFINEIDKASDEGLKKLLKF